ncbi:MAG: chemotaxis protein CheX [Planctomycetes bacterium]|nr:chemotaxis protein CheX [Planctomycetota bacterium]
MTIHTETDSNTQALLAAVNDVFEQMIGLAPNSASVSAAPELSGDIVGALGFCGSRSGLCVITANDDLARVMCASLLMMEPEELTDPADLSDGFGEVVNMVLGGFKQHWVEQGNTMDMSVPSVSFGHPVTVAAARKQCDLFCLSLAFDAGNLGVTLVFNN